MEVRRRTQAIGLAGLCLLAPPLLRLARPFPPASPSVPPRLSPPPPRDPAEAALREAAKCRNRARIAVNEEREALEAWDPQGLAGTAPEAWRLKQMAADRGSDMERARVLARQATLLARTREEEYAATELLVLIEHETGHHAVELQSARTLVALQPRRPRAWMVLRRAARCNGLQPLARQADAVVAVLETVPSH